MAGIIKKQILKHLSRFTKNLSPDKINLSTLKGEGQLTNLELDEEVLQNMLDLPTWLAINKVFCNKAAIRIPWTKLKTHPISLSLDKVIMEMSTCEEPRARNGPSPLANASGQSEYGFAEKVVEGISLSVNSIVIRISAKAFNASFELSQLRIYSVNPNWQHGDLRFTRIQHPQRGEVLTFKEINWQMIRIEADAIQSCDHEIMSAPVRLITNQSKMRITLKRRLKDCNVVTSKLILMLDDLLWVLTDSQLKAMVQYAKSLSEAIEKSAEQRKSMASEPILTCAPVMSSQQVKPHQTPATVEQNDAIAKLFYQFDVKETSHHLLISHLDLHICDDIHSTEKGFNRRITGGAMQLSFNQINVDYYPSHVAGDSCSHWMHYGDPTKTRCGWTTELLDEFTCNVDMLKQAVKDHQASSPAKSAPQGSPQHMSAGKEKISTTISGSFLPPPQQPKAKLMSSSVVVQLADFTIFQVSTADKCRSSPKTMISCNKKSLYLPQEMSAIHIEFTEYYFPDGKDYPIPCPNLYMQLNALQIIMDHRSILWLNQFVLDLRHSLSQFMAMYKLNDSSKSEEHIDVRVDGLMLKCIIPAEKKLNCHPDQPRAISVQTSEVIATNTRQSPNCRRSDLEVLFQDFKKCPFFSKSFTDFPRSSDSFDLLHPIFQRHAFEQDTKMHDVYRGHVTPKLNVHALKAPAAKDIWAMHFSQFWADYEGMKSGKGRPINFVDSFPLSVWICQPVRYAQSQNESHCYDQNISNIPKSDSLDMGNRLQRKKLLKDYYSTDSELQTSNSSTNLSTIPTQCSTAEADIHILANCQKHVSMQINHYQYIFLLLLQRHMEQVLENVKKDGEEVTGKPAKEMHLCVGALLKSAEVALLLNPLPQGNSCKTPAFEDGDIPPDLIGDKVNDNNLGQVGRTVSKCGSINTDLNNIPMSDPLLCISSNETELHKDIIFPDTAAFNVKNIGTIGENVNTSDRLLTISDKTAALFPESLEVIGNHKEDTNTRLIPKALTEEDLPNFTVFQDMVTADPLIKATDFKPETIIYSQDIEVNKEILSTCLTDISPLTLSEMDNECCPTDLPIMSVAFKSMQRTSSQLSLDTISFDSNSEEHLIYSDDHILMDKDIGIASANNFQSSTETADGSLQNENGSSPDTMSAASECAQENSQEMMSVVVLKIFDVNCGIDIKGEDMAVCLQVGQVMPKELGNVAVRHYYSNRSMGADFKTFVEPKKTVPEILLRFESGPNTIVHSPLAEKNGFLQCCIENLNSEIHISSLTNLQHFVEDDSVAAIMPMRIKVSDTCICLKDDGTSQNTSIPESPPVNLHIKDILIERNDDGSFCIKGMPSRESEELLQLNETHHSMQSNSVTENTTRKDCFSIAIQTEPEKVLSEPSKVNRSSAWKATDYSKEQLIDENDCLKQELAKTKLALAESQMERDSLLHQIKRMAVENKH
ncbi:bridge-like lipid transfer protein family member 3B isoform X2 [Ambystoma mexicanum]|uniref:bridge-like lipid transfer protein family member 3B isoform X2 n=1 Tax=Ambystoma mexicanum TaxID=8296 RepID=UPI0037E90D45